jgi:hypothetical protein
VNRRSDSRFLESRTTSLALLLVRNGNLVENDLQLFGNKIETRVFGEQAVGGGNEFRPKNCIHWTVGDRRYS